ncbi:hypothetical protein THIX_90022 [Thiomonas sp. X19]|nr:hypothetical protein THIX_90022 [Thiomonas sp. X19]
MSSGRGSVRSWRGKCHASLRLSCHLHATSLLTRASRSAGSPLALDGFGLAGLAPQCWSCLRRIRHRLRAMSHVVLALPPCGS